MLKQIFYVTVFIAVAVIALFFALLTNERLGLYGVLKAVGGRTRTLFAGLALQAVVLTTIASAVASLLAVLTDRLVPPTAVPFTLTLSGALTAVVSLLLASVFGAAFSLRRITRIDPAQAIGGSL